MKRMMTCGQCGASDFYAWDVVRHEFLGGGRCTVCQAPLLPAVTTNDRRRPAPPTDDQIRVTVTRLEALGDPLASAWAWMGRQILKRRGAK